MTLEGHPFMVLTLEGSGDELAGTLVRPGTMSSDGLTVSKIGSDVLRERVTAAPDGPVLRVIASNPNEPDDKTEFEFRLIAADDAEIKPAGAPIEPWPLSRHTGDRAPDIWTGWDSQRSYAIQLPAAAPNPEMAAIYQEDQAARQSMESFESNTERIAREDAQRRERVRALLAAGELRAGEDYRLAALVFQHGNEPDDYLLAHTLALVGLARGDRSAAWIAAASLDRYLRSIGKPQIFGTQFSRDGLAQQPYDTALISDALRRELGVPPLAVQQEQFRTLLQSSK